MSLRVCGDCSIAAGHRISHLSGHNFELADTAVEVAAGEVKLTSLWQYLWSSRDVKKDVVEIVKGPTGGDNIT